jgi:hypothetical protein
MNSFKPSEMGESSVGLSWNIIMEASIYLLYLAHCMYYKKDGAVCPN